MVGLQYGPFADNSAELHEFINDVMTELAPQTAQERAEALNIAGLCVRRSRLVELEALALAETTRVREHAIEQVHLRKTTHKSVAAEEVR